MGESVHPSIHPGLLRLIREYELPTYIRNKIFTYTEKPQQLRLQRREGKRAVRFFPPIQYNECVPDLFYQGSFFFEFFFGGWDRYVISR